MQLVRLTRFALACSSALSFLACADHPPDAVEPASTKPFPPPSTPVVPSPLTDQSRNLDEILEQGTLSPSDCDSYFAGQTDRTTTLRCGKWMFFYANIDVPGSPSKLVDLMRENAPNTVGRSLERFGLFPDPYSPTGLPVGLATGPEMVGGVSTYTLTCGSCHFGQTPDGRYVVGQPNHQFSFSRFTLSVASLPELAFDPKKQLPDEVERVVGPVRDEVFANDQTRLDVMAQAFALLPNVIATGTMPPDDAAKLALAANATGVMDPYSPPSVDDGVPIPVRMSPLWGIDPAAMKAAGSEHGAMLGSNGGAPDLQHILRTFACIAGKIRALPLCENYDEAKVLPLIEYILSLNPPRPEKTPDPASVASGRELFRKSCFGCHNGPGFATIEVHDPSSIGTDSNIVRLLDPTDTGMAVYNLLTPAEITKGVRARRLTAVWSLGRLFHNGSASSLGEVFCLDGPRAESSMGPGHSTAGHSFTCQGPSDEEKRNLIAFLESL